MIFLNEKLAIIHATPSEDLSPQKCALCMRVHHTRRHASCPEHHELLSHSTASPNMCSLLSATTMPSPTLPRLLLLLDARSVLANLHAYFSASMACAGHRQTPICYICKQCLLCGMPSDEVISKCRRCRGGGCTSAAGTQASAALASSILPVWQ